MHTGSKPIIRHSRKRDPSLIFEGTTNLNELVEHICDQTSLYAAQHRREFATDP